MSFHDAPKSLSDITLIYRNIFKSLKLPFPSFDELRNFQIPRVTVSKSNIELTTRTSLLEPYFSEVSMKFQSTRVMPPSPRARLNGQVKKGLQVPNGIDARNSPGGAHNDDGLMAGNRSPLEPVEVSKRKVVRRYKFCSDKNHELEKSDMEDEDEHEIEEFYAIDDEGPLPFYLKTTSSIVSAGTIPLPTPVSSKIPQKEPILTINLEQEDDGDLNDMDILIIDLSDAEKAEFVF